MSYRLLFVFQLDSLEELFVTTKYVDDDERERIAEDLDLSEETVRVGI